MIREYEFVVHGLVEVVEIDMEEVSRAVRRQTSKYEVIPTHLLGDLVAACAAQMVAAGAGKPLAIEAAAGLASMVLAAADGHARVQAQLEMPTNNKAAATEPQLRH